MARNKIEYYIGIIKKILIFCIIVIILFAYKARKLHQNEVASQIPKEALKYIFFEKKRHKQPRDANSIAHLINLHNQEETILNADIYGPIAKDTLVFVVTVHKLSIYLEFLLVSLSQVRGIEKVLIIFSHSYYDDAINNLIQSIDFARVLQIYYPYSLQVYPDEFPGYSPLDCTHNMNMQDAEAVNCTGALYPDIHGLYRNPSQSETKHQWWWTANTIFDKLSCMKNHTGTFVFLNNDIYLLQDFIYMIVYMNQLGEFLPHHDFLSLDAVLDLNKIDAYRADIEKWVPTNNPDVLAFSAATWNSIVYHYDLFCRIDDYSWAKSLYYISLNRKDKKEPFKVMSTALARAFKTSNCGFEAKLVDCDVIETVFQVSNLQKNIKDDLFPSYLDVYTKLELHDEFESIEYADLNGGWNDPRDKEMCNNMLNREKKTTPSDTKITNYNSDYRDFSI